MDKTTAPKREFYSKPSRDARMALFRIADEKSEILADLYDETFDLYQKIPERFKKRNVKFWQDLHRWAELVTSDKWIYSHRGWRSNDFREKWGFEETLIVDLKDALTRWCEAWRFDILGDWVFTFALYQLWDHEKHPGKPLGFSWHRLKPSLILTEFRPEKFIYTLRVPDEEYLTDTWGDEQPEIQSFGFGRVKMPNPYEVENSQNGASLRGLSIVESVRAELGLDHQGGTLNDWNPDSDESKLEAFERIVKDFKIRLRKHLNVKKKEYEQIGMGYMEKPELERDALWSYQRHFEGLLCREIADAHNEQLELKAQEKGGKKKDVVDEKLVWQQVDRFMKLIDARFSS